MKVNLYHEIQELEDSDSPVSQRRGRIIRLVADATKCFTCLDSRRYWKDRDNMPWCALDGQGYFDIMGCIDCDNRGWTTCSYKKEVRENGTRVFHRDNRDERERLDELFFKGSNDSDVVEQARQWVLQQAPVTPLPSDPVLDIPPPPPIESLPPPPAPLTPPAPPAPPAPVEPAPQPLFQVCKRLTRESKEESIEGEVEIGKIVNTIKDVVQAYFGDIFSLVELCRQLTVSFTMSDSQSISHDKIIKISDNNYLGIKTCTRLTDEKLSLGFMKGSRHAKEYSADIFILQPLNQPAVERANLIMSKIAAEMTEEILEHF